MKMFYVEYLQPHLQTRAVVGWSACRTPHSGGTPPPVRSMQTARSGSNLTGRSETFAFVATYVALCATARDGLKYAQIKGW